MWRKLTQNLQTASLNQVNKNLERGETERARKKDYLQPQMKKAINMIKFGQKISSADNKYGLKEAKDCFKFNRMIWN